MGRSKSLLVSLLGLASWPAIACYTVYDRANSVVYYSDTAPVDMSRPLHETVPVRFPGGHMVFGTEQCTMPESLLYGVGGHTLATASPLLTDERTARAMNAPYHPLGHGVVVVQQKDAKMRPGVDVLPAFKPSAQVQFQAPAPQMQMPPPYPPSQPEEAPQQRYRRRY